MAKKQLSLSQRNCRTGDDLFDMFVFNDRRHKRSVMDMIKLAFVWFDFIGKHIVQEDVSCKRSG